MNIDPKIIKFGCVAVIKASTFGISLEDACHSPELAEAGEEFPIEEIEDIASFIGRGELPYSYSSKVWKEPGNKKVVGRSIKARQLAENFIDICAFTETHPHTLPIPLIRYDNVERLFSNITKWVESTSFLKDVHVPSPSLYKPTSSDYSQYHSTSTASTVSWSDSSVYNNYTREVPEVIEGEVIRSEVLEIIRELGFKFDHRFTNDSPELVLQPDRYPLHGAFLKRLCVAHRSSFRKLLSGHRSPYLSSPSCSIDVVSSE